MKAIIPTECIITYSDYEKLFHIYTNASEYQVSTVIIQEGKLVAYFSKTILPAQMDYLTTENKLLAIILCLKEISNYLEMKIMLSNDC